VYHQSTGRHTTWGGMTHQEDITLVITFERIDIHFKFGTDIDDGPLLRPDHKTTPKWAWPRSRDQISKFWDLPYNSGTNRDICFKVGIDIDDGPLLRPDHKMTP